MIEQIDLGFFEISLYYFFHVLGFATVAAFNVWYGKKYGISWHKALIFTAIVYSLTYLWIHVQFWIETGFKIWGGQNIVRGFVYVPLIAYPIARLMRMQWRKTCDFIAPCVCIAQGVSHVGCIFPGCCHGYPWQWGIYNNSLGVRTFPVQLLEAATAWIIVFVIVYRAYEKKYASDGVSYPLMLFLFGSTRFLWEFMRDNDKIFLGCSSLSFHALFMAAVGGAFLLILSCREKRTAKLNKKLCRRKQKKRK